MYVRLVSGVVALPPPFLGVRVSHGCTGYCVLQTGSHHLAIRTGYTEEGSLMKACIDCGGLFKVADDRHLYCRDCLPDGYVLERPLTRADPYPEDDDDGWGEMDDPPEEGDT